MTVRVFLFNIEGFAAAMKLIGLLKTTLQKDERVTNAD